MGNFESSMSSIIDNDHESDSSSEDIEIRGESDSSHNDLNDDFSNLRLQRFINT